MSGEPRHHITEAMFVEYVADTLDMADRRKIEAHLMTCESCRQTVSEWRQIASAARTGKPSLPPLNWRLIKGDDPMIIERPMTAMPRQPVAVRRFNFAFPMTFAALAIAAVTLFSLMGGPSGEDGNFGMVGQNQQNDEATATPLTPLMTPTPTAAEPIVFPTATPLVLELPPTIVAPDDIPLMTPTPALSILLTPQPLDPYNMVNQPEYMVIVVAAAADIAQGSVIKPEDLTLYAIDERFVPENLRITPDALIYRIARVNLACGQILMPNMVAENAHDITPDAADFTLSENCAAVKKSHVQAQIPFQYNTVRYYITDVSHPAVYYTRELPAGHTITADDVTVRNVPVPELIPSGAATSLDAVIGQTLTTPVIEGQAAIVE